MNPPPVTNQSSSADSYMVMENKFQQKAAIVTKLPPRRISRRESDDEPIFHLEGLQGMNISEEETKVQQNNKKSPQSPGDLDKDKNSLEQKRYKQRGNKHKDDYCFVDLGFEDSKIPVSKPTSEVKKRSGSFSFSNNRKWKSITFNKQK